MAPVAPVLVTPSSGYLPPVIPKGMGPFLRAEGVAVGTAGEEAERVPGAERVGPMSTVGMASAALGEGGGIGEGGGESGRSTRVDIVEAPPPALVLRGGRGAGGVFLKHVPILDAD